MLLETSRGVAASYKYLIKSWPESIFDGVRVLNYKDVGQENVENLLQVGIELVLHVRSKTCQQQIKDKTMGDYLLKSIMEAGRGYWAVYCTGPQSFIIALFYSLFEHNLGIWILIGWYIKLGSY